MMIAEDDLSITDSESAVSGSDDNEVQPFLSNDSRLESQAAYAQGSAELTKVTSPSLAGIVAEDVLDTVSRHSRRDGAFSAGGYGSIAHRISSRASDELGEASNLSQDETQDANGGYLVPKAQLTVILGSVFSLIFLAALDSTILSTLVADIASDLDAIPYISWITTAYCSRRRLSSKWVDYRIFSAASQCFKVASWFSQLGVCSVQRPRPPPRL